MTMTGASLRFPGCQWQWASKRDSGSTWKRLASAGGISNRLGTKAETIVMAWAFFSKGWTSNGGRAVSIAELYFTKTMQTSSSYSSKVREHFCVRVITMVRRFAKG